MDGKLGQLKATIAQFFRINGGSTQHRGVLPDIVFPTVISLEDHGERSLDNALPWAAIEPARYTAVSFPEDNLELVRQHHEQRVLNDPAFQAVLATEKAIKQARARTDISLVETVRRREYEQARLDQRERENQIRVVRGLEPLPPPGDSDPEDTDSESDTDAEEEAFDVVLNEAGRIMHDLLTASRLDKRLVDNNARVIATVPATDAPVAESPGESQLQ